MKPQRPGYNDKQISDLYASLQRKIAALPGVTGVSYASGALLDGGLWSGDVNIEGQADKSPVKIQLLAVGPDYFQTMRIPLLDGRLLTETDTNGAKHALVNRAFVTKFLSGRNPLGLHFGGGTKPDTEIVGVVGDMKYLDLRGEDEPTAYTPLASGDATFEVRTALAPAELMPAVRKVVNAVDANLPVMRMRTQTDAIPTEPVV